MPLDVRPIKSDEHRGFVADATGRGLDVSFLQTPEWAGAKAEWGNLSLGWFDGDKLVGAGLVLTRRVPKSKMWLAYLPEGPVIDWSAYPASDILSPMLDLLKGRGAFMVKMGPTVPVRTWKAATLKAAIANKPDPDAPAVTTINSLRLRQVPADEEHPTGIQLLDQLQKLGWTQKADTGAGFGDVQPRYVFQIPLEAKTEDEVFAGFNQLWRRNIRKADKLGVEIVQGTRDQLAEFHPIYVETAERDGFVARGLEYFERMWDSLNEFEPNRMRLYLAKHDGTVLAATTTVHVGGHTWYSYGASANLGREVKPSNAIQWKMITDSLSEGSRVYDLRGISDTLDEKDPLFGLIRFKLGTGGEALEYIGEWDYALRPGVAKAFDVYMRRSDIAAGIKSKFTRKSESRKAAS